MADLDHIQEPEDTPLAPARRSPPWASALLLLLMAVAAGYAWYAHGRAATLEQALATATGERDAALAETAQRQALLGQGEAERATLDARRLELEQELTLAREEVQRLRTAAAASAAAVEPEAAPPAPPAAVTELPASTAPASAAAAPAAPATPAAGAPQPLRAAADPVAEPTPPPAPAPAAETLTITFDVNSSYFPASLNGRLRQLASRLRPGQAYAVQLTGSVGTDPVANGAAGAAAAYNRWIAERRMSRVADFLQANADAGPLAIEQAYAANDPSRRVVVKVRPVLP